jgi:hypothetical protein
MRRPWRSDTKNEEDRQKTQLFAAGQCGSLTDAPERCLLRFNKPAALQ